MFKHTLERLAESQNTIREAVGTQVHDLVYSSTNTDKSMATSAFKFQRRNESRQTLHSIVEPLGDLDLNLDNAAYESYDREDEFIAEFIKQSKKAVRQWKAKMSSNLVFPRFLSEMSTLLTHQFKEQIFDQKLSLLGALYLEKIIRKLKAFLQYLSERPQPNIIEDLVEIA